MCLSSHLGGKETIPAAMSLNWGECLEVCSSEGLMVTPEYFIGVVQGPGPGNGTAHNGRSCTLLAEPKVCPEVPLPRDSSRAHQVDNKLTITCCIYSLTHASSSFPRITKCIISFKLCLSLGWLNFVHYYLQQKETVFITVLLLWRDSDLHSPGLRIHRVRFYLRHGRVTISAYCGLACSQNKELLFWIFLSSPSFSSCFLLLLFFSELTCGLNAAESRQFLPQR